MKEKAKLNFFAYENRDKLYRHLGVSVPNGIDDLDAILNPESPDEDISPLIANMFNQMEINILFGEEKIGKSFLANSIAHAIVCGRNLDPYHAISEAKSVWLVSGEMTNIQRKKQAETSGHMYPHDYAAGPTFLLDTTFPRKLDDEEGQQLFEKLLNRANSNNKSKKKISVVILDNLKTLTTSGEQVAGWKSLFNYLNKLRIEYKLTFIIIHHPVKSGSMGGTSDVNIKIDTNWQVTRNSADVSPFDAADKLKLDGKYNEYLYTKLSEWRLEHPNDIWFFLVNRAGRSLTPTAKRTVFMHMNPDDEKPCWDVIDFLAIDNPWSYQAFKASVAEANALPEAPQGREKAYDGEERPTYDMLKQSKERDYILKWLRIAYKETDHTREKMGQFFGCPEGKGKEAIDYLTGKHPCTKKHRITEKDYGGETPLSASADVAENKG